MAHSKSRVDRAGRVFASEIKRVRDSRSRGVRDVTDLVHSLEVIEWWRKEHAKPLSRVAASLRNYASEEGKPIVAQRLKRIPTIAGKLLREPTMKLSRMGDIGGVRAVLPDQEAAYRVAARLRHNWTITRFSDYVRSPKDDGYRGLHLINRNRGRLIEVQLRTPRQDHWANGVEMFSRSIAPGLKFGDGPSELRKYFLALGEMNEAMDAQTPFDPAIFNRLMELQAWVDTFVDEESNES
jgi:RelA/SpoT family protein